MTTENCECTIEGCDIFDFMAKYVGLMVIHPGGFKATRKLVETCHVDKYSRVVDIACGKGTSAIYIAEKYGCKVVGIDISEDLIAEANFLTRKKRLSQRVTFRVGDALDLPFHNDEFDVAVSQAMLVLVKDKRRTIHETLRVIKPGGYLGWLELSWKKQPTKEFLDAVSNILCAYCMKNVETYAGWSALLKEAGVKALETLSFSLGNTGMSGMLADEGFINTVKVMYKYLTNASLRNRMNTMNQFFREHTDYFGYGVYAGRK